MSLSGSLAMGLLRWIKPGKGSFSDLEKLRERAQRENEGFTLRMPRNRKAECVLLPETTLPCMVVRPRRLDDMDKAIMYLYGGVTNHWNTQRSMAVRYAVDTGSTIWYPVYPSISEACVTDGLAYLAGIYRRMLEQYDAAKIAISGVSMGGLYALELINWINHERAGLPMPGLLIAHSPGGVPDDEADWSEFRSYEARDPMFAEGDLRMTERLMPCEGPLPLWALSPARGDFTGAPPTYLYYGEEMLAGNAPLYRRAYERGGAGKQLHVTIEGNMIHGYSCMPVFPESRRAYRETIHLIQEL